MRKLITLAVALMISSICFAQKDVTKFLGIPVDGTKSAMIQKLKDKGYTYNSRKDCLEGEFNGRNVEIYVVTNLALLKRYLYHIGIYLISSLHFLQDNSPQLLNILLIFQII